MYYLIAFLEWFTTLAVEIIAIRISSTIVGANIVWTSIFLWIILFALSLWYFFGWKVSKISKDKLHVVLSCFLCFAGIYYVWASFLFEEQLLIWFMQNGNNFIISLFAVSILLFAMPILFASTTVPILTELVKSNNKWEASWKILFWSTIWSFLWSVVTSIFLFPSIWVHASSILIWEILILIAVIFVFPKNRKISILFFILGIVIALLNIAFKTENINAIYAFDSPYQNIRIVENDLNWEKVRFFLSDYKYYSWIYTKDKTVSFGYLKQAIKTSQDLKPESILLLWTAGFAYPQNMSKEKFVKKIVAIDVDPYIKEIAENHFLQEKISDKIDFHPQQARLFVNQDKQKYDLVFMDTYIWTSIPEQLASVEFLEKLKDRSDKIMINFIWDKNLESDRSKNFLSTAKKAFGEIYIKKIWKESNIMNFIILNFPAWWFERKNTTWKVYTDDLNNAQLDYIKMHYNL